MKNSDNTYINVFFKESENDITRGHSKKLFKQRNRLNIRNHFFSQRVIDFWNALPQEAIDADSIDTFKKHLSYNLNNIILGLHKPLAFSPLPLL